MLSRRTSPPRSGALLPVLVAAAMAGCARAMPPAEALRTSLRELPSPAPATSAQPQLAVGSDGRVYLSWLEKTDGGHRFQLASLEGERWSDPRSIAEGDRFFANWADVPSIFALSSGTLAAHWLEYSGPGKYAYDVKLRLSDDDGATWSAPVSPHHDGTQTEHGFVSFFERPEGGLGLIWLDGRDFAEHGSEGMEGMQAEMALRAALFDGTVPGPDAAVDSRVCECCPTAAVRTTDGVVVTYRDRSSEEVRNIAVARLEGDRWTEPAHVHDDGWRIPGCPVNGPAFLLAYLSW